MYSGGSGVLTPEQCFECTRVPQMTSPTHHPLGKVPCCCRCCCMFRCYLRRLVRFRDFLCMTFGWVQAEGNAKGKAKVGQH